MRLSYLLVAAMLALGAPALAADCAEWNTWGFFETATLEEVVSCLEAGVDVNARNASGWTPLHYVTRQADHPAIVEALLEAGADVNARRTSDSRTPLHFVTRQADDPAIIILEVLLEAGADTNARDKDSWTPLHFAAQYSDNPAIIRSLLEAGADASARNEAGFTPEHYALERGAPRDILVGLGAATGGLTDCGWWNTPEFFAWASVTGLEACLETGAEVDARTEFGLTPLHFAASAPAEAAVIRRLIEAGASLNARTESGLAPLHLAAVTAIPALLEAGADLNARTESGRTPLHNAAAETDGLAAITVLLGAGADVTVRDYRDRTPLHFAAANTDNPAVITALLAAGAEVNAQSEDGWTPLHVAVEGNGLAIVLALLDAGAWVNVQGFSPLHAAARGTDDPDVIEALLEAGADASAQDGEGMTPWHYARDNLVLKGTKVYWRLNDARFE